MSTQDSTWQIVQARTDYPGACNVTGEHQGPFLQTDLHVAFDGRFAPTVALVERLAAAIGWQPPAGESHPDRRIADLEDELACCYEQIAEDDELRRAVFLTLRDGAVVSKNGVIALRERPRRFQALQGRREAA